MTVLMNAAGNGRLRMSVALIGGGCDLHTRSAVRRWHSRISVYLYLHTCVRVGAWAVPTTPVRGAVGPTRAALRCRMARRRSILLRGSGIRTWRMCCLRRERWRLPLTTCGGPRGLLFSCMWSPVPLAARGAQGGETAVHYAAHYGHAAACSCGATMSSARDTAECGRRWTDCLRSLIAGGADVNAAESV